MSMARLLAAVLTRQRPHRRSSGYHADNNCLDPFQVSSAFRLSQHPDCSGDTTLVQSLLAGIFLAWLILPISIPRADVSFFRLRHLPLSVRDLFGFRIVSLFITPYSWMIVAGSLAICYPLAHAPRPWLALAAALLFIPMSCSTGLAMAHFLTIAVWRRIMFAILVLLCATALYVLSGEDAGPFRQWSWVLPTNLVTSAAVGKNPTL